LLLFGSEHVFNDLHVYKCMVIFWFGFRIGTFLPLTLTNLKSRSVAIHDTECSNRLLIM
jgi:hypothetical protein